MYFEGNDLKLIEALRFDPALEPGFEALKGCLVWADERPDGLTPEGYEKLCDLWIARNHIHQGDPAFARTLDPAYFARAWSEALASGIEWPGFRRIELGAKDRAFLDQCLRDPHGGL